MIMKRWLKRGVVAGFVGLILMIGLVMWIRSSRISRGMEELNVAIAETEAVEPKWRWDDLEAIRYRNIPPEQNIAEILLQLDAAERSLPPREYQPFSAIDFAMRDVSDHPNVKLLDDDANVVRYMWTQLGPMVELFDQLKDCKDGYLPLTITPDWVSTLMPHVQKYRTAFMMCRIQTWLALHDGKMQEAGEMLRRQMTLVASMGDQPSLIGQLVRIAGGAISRADLERILGQGEVPEPLLAELQPMFEAESRYPFFSVGIRGERAGCHHLMTNLHNGSLTTGVVMGGGTAGMMERFQNWRQKQHMPKNHAFMIRFYNRCIEIGKLPSWEQVEAMKAVTMPPQESEWVFAGLLLPASEKIHQSEMRQESWLKCASVAIACERYRMKHKRWPTNVSELVPEFCESVPLDTYTGKPLMLRVVKEGLLVYSTGPDLVDDNGTLWKSGSTFEKGLDYGFRLWNPDQRGLPAKERPPEMLEMMPMEIE